MKRVLLFSLMLIGLRSLAQNTSDASLTVEKIMSDIKWIGAPPSNISWTWDSKAVIFSWNPDRNIADSFYIYRLNGKEPEKLAYNEALRQKAITNGKSNANRSLIVYSYGGDIHLLNTATGSSVPLTQTEDAETSPRFIQNDEWIVYHCNNNLFAFQLKTGLTRQLSNFIKEPSKNPKPASTQQDLFLQHQALDNSSVLRWRKLKKEAREHFLDSNKLKANARAIITGDKLVTEAEASATGSYVFYTLFTQDPNKTTLVPSYVTETGYTTNIPGREKVGGAQGTSESFIYNRVTDSVYAVKLDSIPGILDNPDYVKDYPALKKDKASPRKSWVAGVYWNDQQDLAILDIRSVDNKDRWLMSMDPATAHLELISRQRDEAWISGPGISSFQPVAGWLNDHSFYFQSEQTGYSHLYSYDIQSHATTALTTGKFEILDARLSKTRKAFYLLTNELHPGQYNWYKLTIDGLVKERITQKVGTYEVSLSPDEKNIAYRYSYITKPWELFVQENKSNANVTQVTFKGASELFKQYPWRDTRIFTFTARDGAPVYAKLFDPKPGTKNNAAVIFVHGAGYLQNVHFGWSNNYPREYMFNNLLADKGYTVIDIDYRGSSGYGRNWRTGIYRYMGGKDLDDEVDAARYLVRELGIDSTRIGMYGGSYGGFMTLMAMFTQPDVIKAGAALRPVTDWAHYNHGYTSDILNEPATDSMAYARSSPINFAAGLKNHLLICHGMIDQNVHYQDAVRLTQKLIELGKDNWELASFPLEDHGFVEPSSWTDEYKRILKLFDQHLLR